MDVSTEVKHVVKLLKLSFVVIFCWSFIAGCDHENPSSDTFKLATEDDQASVSIVEKKLESFDRFTHDEMSEGSQLDTAIVEFVKHGGTQDCSGISQLQADLVAEGTALSDAKVFNVEEASSFVDKVLWFLRLVVAFEKKYQMSCSVGVRPRELAEKVAGMILNAQMTSQAQTVAKTSKARSAKIKKTTSPFVLLKDPVTCAIIMDVLKSMLVRVEGTVKHWRSTGQGLVDSITIFISNRFEELALVEGTLETYKVGYGRNLIIKIENKLREFACHVSKGSDCAKYAKKKFKKDGNCKSDQPLIVPPSNSVEPDETTDGPDKPKGGKKSKKRKRRRALDTSSDSAIVAAIEGTQDCETVVQLFQEFVAEENTLNSGGKLNVGKFLSFVDRFLLFLREVDAFEKKFGKNCGFSGESRKLAERMTKKIPNSQLAGSSLANSRIRKSANSVFVLLKDPITCPNIMNVLKSMLARVESTAEHWYSTDPHMVALINIYISNRFDELALVEETLGTFKVEYGKNLILKIKNKLHEFACLLDPGKNCSSFRRMYFEKDEECPSNQILVRPLEPVKEEEGPANSLGRATITRLPGSGLNPLTKADSRQRSFTTNSGAGTPALNPNNSGPNAGRESKKPAKVNPPASTSSTPSKIKPVEERSPSPRQPDFNDFNISKKPALSNYQNLKTAKRMEEFSEVLRSEVTQLITVFGELSSALSKRGQTVSISKPVKKVEFIFGIGNNWTLIERLFEFRDSFRVCKGVFNSQTTEDDFDNQRAWYELEVKIQNALKRSIIEEILPRLLEAFPPKVHILVINGSKSARTVWKEMEDNFATDSTASKYKEFKDSITYSGEERRAGHLEGIGAFKASEVVNDFIALHKELVMPSSPAMTLNAYEDLRLPFDAIVSQLSPRCSRLSPFSVTQSRDYSAWVAAVKSYVDSLSTEISFNKKPFCIRKRGRLNTYSEILSRNQLIKMEMKKSQLRNAFVADQAKRSERTVAQTTLSQPVVDPIPTWSPDGLILSSEKGRRDYVAKLQQLFPDAVSREGKPVDVKKRLDEVERLVSQFQDKPSLYNLAYILHVIIEHIEDENAKETLRIVKEQVDQLELDD